MIAATLLIWALVLGTALVVWRREGRTGIAQAGRHAVDQGRALMVRLPLALVATAFLMHALPLETLSHVIGPA